MRGTTARQRDTDAALGIGQGPQDAWWLHRTPRTDREHLELAALSWIPDDQLERIRLTVARFPDLRGQVASDVLLGLSTYEKRRAAVLELGKTLTGIRPMPSDAELDAAAELVRTFRPQALAREAQAAFRMACLDGRWPGPEFIRWGDAIEAESDTYNTLNGARALLGLRVGLVGAQPTRPRLLDALEAAFTGGSRRPEHFGAPGSAIGGE